MQSESKRFSIVRRAKSFTHALRGLRILFATTHNAWIQIVAFAAVVTLGFYVQLSGVEWVLVLLASGFVLVSEAFNTAIEIDINLTSPEYHPYAKDTKDVAAGAVLLAALFAAIVGLIVFMPHVMVLAEV